MPRSQHLRLSLACLVAVLFTATTPAQVPDDLKAKASDGKPAARIEAINQIGKIGTPEDYAFLISLITDPEEAIHVPASKAVDQILEREQSAIEIVGRKLEKLTDFKSKEARDMLEDLQVKVNIIKGYGEDPTRCAVQLRKWRVATLNLPVHPSRDIAEQLLSEIRFGLWDDGPLDPDEQIGIGGDCTGESIPNRLVLRGILKSYPSVVSDYLEDTSHGDRSGLLELMWPEDTARVEGNVLELTSDRDDTVRLAATIDLVSLEKKSLSGEYERLTSDRQISIRLKALDGLVKADPLSGLRVALAFLDDKNERSSAIKDIRQLSDPSCVSALSSLTNSKDRELAVAACEGIGCPHSDLATSMLESIALAGPADLRLAAIGALVSCDQEGAEAALIKCLSDRDPVIVKTACESLSRLGEPSALKQLATLINSPMDGVGKTARAAVATLQPKPTLPPP